VEYGTESNQFPYSDSRALEASVSGESRSLLGGLLDSAASVVLTAFETYGWIVPASLLTILFFAGLVVLCWMLDDLPLEFEVLTAPRSIFDWTRKRWVGK
jgi:uncharacterized membrane protein YqgA involved in biofilm formation